MPEPKKYWLDRSENVTRLYQWLWAACMALVAVDIFLHKHEVFEFASWFGFYGIYGFVACVVLVLTAKQLRRILMRDEDYYDR